MEKIITITNALLCFVEAVYFYRFVIFHCGYKEGKKNIFITGIWCFLFGLLVAVFNTDRFAPIGTSLALFEVYFFGILYLQRGGVYKVVIIGMALFLVAAVDMLVAVCYMLTIGDALAYQQMMEPVIRGLLSIFAKFILVIVSEIYFMFKRKFINYKVNGAAGFCSLIGIVIICVIFFIQVMEFFVLLFLE